MGDQPKFPSQLAERFQLRMPDGMRDRIAAEAQRNKRSMNTEIVARIEASFDNQNNITDKKSIEIIAQDASMKAIRAVIAAFDELPPEKRGKIEDVVMRAGEMLDAQDRS